MLPELTLTERAELPPAEWLEAWTQGYAEGYEARNAVIVSEWMWYLAEDLAALDRASFDAPARERWRDRIAREVANDRHARPVRQTDDWPPVAVPGGGVS